MALCQEILFLQAVLLFFDKDMFDPSINLSPILAKACSFLIFGLFQLTCKFT